MKSIIAVAVCMLAFGACQVATLPQRADERASPTDRLFHRGSLTVMTRGLGTNLTLERVREAARAAQEADRAAEVFADLCHEDLAARARRLADEIQYARPHLIGLQQVTEVRVQSPGDALFGGTRPAERLVQDLLALLLAELETRGLHYREVARVDNADVELSLLTRAGGSFDDVRLKDFDVILARTDVDVTGVRTGHFHARREVHRPGLEPLSLPRGWASVAARVDGRRYRFVSTHLEPSPDEEGLRVQRAQAEELIRALRGEPLPVVLVGDFNTPANLGLVGAPTYGELLLAGYVDVWAHRLGHDGLRRQGLALEERRELVLVRQPMRAHLKRMGPVLAYALENTREEWRAGPWRAERTGVVARLRIPASPRN